MSKPPPARAVGHAGAPANTAGVSAGARAARRGLFVFRLARTSKRITRVYVYQWRKTQTGDRFDAGLVAPDDTPRPSLSALRRQLGPPPANLNLRSGG